jgi:hypothetical protein
MEVNEARRLKELEQENGRLKRLVADQMEYLNEQLRTGITQLER